MALFTNFTPIYEKTSEVIERLKKRGARVIEGDELARVMADSTDTQFSAFTGTPIAEDDHGIEGQEPTDG